MEELTFEFIVFCFIDVWITDDDFSRHVQIDSFILFKKTTRL